LTSSVISAGRVDPGRFFKPLKLARTSVPLTFTSNCIGNATSIFEKEVTGSEAQKNKILYDSRSGESLENLATTSGDNLSLISTEARVLSAAIQC
jgi:hypothetical protein